MERRLTQALKKLRLAEEKVSLLQSQLAGAKKDSTNSSKPPSSDIVKPPPKISPRARRRGARKGHPQHERPAFDASDIDFLKRHEHDACPQCGGPVEQLATPAQVVQQVELIEKPMRVTEHHGGTCHCRACGQDFTRLVPPEIAAAGTFGPRLTAYVAYLKGACHASYGTIGKLLGEACKLKISSGTLAKLCHQVAQSLQPSYDALRQELSKQSSLNIDETGHRENGRRQWTWAFRAPQFTVFRIDPTRSTAVLEETLGADFSGTLGADYYGAYRKYLASHPQATGQFCLAHLVRDAKFLAELPDAKDRAFGGELLEELKALFRVWHARQGFTDEATFRAALVAAGKQLERVALERAPQTRASRKIMRRFEKHAAEYLRFTHAPHVEPTNNAAERAIRQVVIDRHVTQGTRSPRGRAWCERIWTTIATCRQQGRDLLKFLEQSLHAWLTDTPPPSLLPASK